jgi:hypothetical protein
MLTLKPESDVLQQHPRELLHWWRSIASKAEFNDWGWMQGKLLSIHAKHWDSKL